MIDMCYIAVQRSLLARRKVHIVYGWIIYLDIRNGTGLVITSFTGVTMGALRIWCPLLGVRRRKTGYPDRQHGVPCAFRARGRW